MRLETWVDGERDWMASADFASEAQLGARLEWAKRRILLERDPGRHSITIDGKEVWVCEIPNTNERPDEASRRYGAMGRGIPRRKKERR